VAGHVVNIGSGGEQFGTIIKVNTNCKRTRLSRAMRRDARKEFSANLECRRAPILCSPRRPAAFSRSCAPYRSQLCLLALGACDLSARTSQPLQRFPLRLLGFGMLDVGVSGSVVFFAMLRIDRVNEPTPNTFFFVANDDSSATIRSVRWRQYGRLGAERN
jgi:hypothetical protein